MSCSLMSSQYCSCEIWQQMIYDSYEVGVAHVCVRTVSQIPENKEKKTDSF
jgi:hypothetical protein